MEMVGTNMFYTMVSLEIQPSKLKFFFLLSKVLHWKNLTTDKMSKCQLEITVAVVDVCRCDRDSCDIDGQIILGVITRWILCTFHVHG